MAKIIQKLDKKFYSDRFYVLLLLLTSFLTYWFAIRSCPQDRLHYQHIAEQSVHLRTKKALEEEPAYQKRNKVQKEIFLEDRSSSIFLKAEESNLKITESKGKAFLEEALFHVSCTIDQMASEEDGEMVSSHLFANKATLHLNSFSPSLFELEDTVRLISTQLKGKESFALADKLTYDPKERTFLFSSKDRVLFWQKDLTLSAPKVLIRQDQSVEGIGDVHFNFNPTEQNLISQFFEKYL